MSKRKSAGFSELYSTRPLEHFDEISFCLKEKEYCDFLILFGHWAKILRLLAKLFQQFCQISKVKVQRNFLMNSSFFEKHWFFSKIQRNVFRCCQKNLLRVHRKTLMKKFLLLTLPFHKSSSDFQRIFFDFCWKVKTIFYVSAGNFVEKYFFSKKISFSPFSNIHRKKSAALPKSFFWNNKFHHSRTRSDILLASVFDIFLSGLSKLHSTRQSDRFDEN